MLLCWTRCTSSQRDLISQNHDFELGFFSPGSSKNRFVGIWYKRKPDVVVWVANWSYPIVDSQGVVLRIGRYGALVTSRDESILWSTNSSRVAASNPILQLLDTGNLVLAVDITEENYIWQSFDYLRDTRLPGCSWCTAQRGRISI